ncbi:ankyrin repeat domain-containing protein [Sporomusa sphaeroides]|uniref:Ankyrin repeats (3 copies) n=1 Tax=Sporomusa sphaeroides DSM 2875 TaxID=1337886 RepID=A0ABM9VZT3_9FIRM|nr:ankyrin repeat domain-containing protein [Sporomusa sphaeroides]OLS56323.1 ankyrin repeats (3 copies) [Sporomusa sphaeroides DSM 2875]CVK18418.1 Ankyrin repeats (3 copies) [Sporomusa sphaeroides DSM 2875]
MSYCNYCGSQAADEAQYCRNCGKKIYRGIFTASDDNEVNTTTVADVSGELKYTAEKSQLLKNKNVYLIIGSIVVIIGIGIAFFGKSEPVSVQSSYQESTKQAMEVNSTKNVTVSEFVECLFNKDVNGAKALIESGLNPNLKDNDGATLLELACAGDNAQIVKLLIDKGANVNVRDTKGGTPLMLAASAGYIETVQVLLSAKDIEINAKDSAGLTALQCAEKTKNGWQKLGLNTSGQEAVIQLLQSGQPKLASNKVSKGSTLGDIRKNYKVSKLWYGGEGMYYAHVKDIDTTFQLYIPIELGVSGKMVQTNPNLLPDAAKVSNVIKGDIYPGDDNIQKIIQHGH